jgi:hypothetical protein
VEKTNNKPKRQSLVEVFEIARTLGLELEIHRDPGLRPETHRLLEAVIQMGKFETKDQAIHAALRLLFSTYQFNTERSGTLEK